MTFPLNLGLHKAGLPLIVVNMFDNNVCLLLDTGSNQNIIDERVYEHFNGKHPEKEPSKQSLTSHGVITGGTTINIPFTFENQDYIEPFESLTIFEEAFEKIYEESGIQVHGILGNHFFLKHGWVLDFEQIKVYKQLK